MLEWPGHNLGPLNQYSLSQSTQFHGIKYHLPAVACPAKLPSPAQTLWDLSIAWASPPDHLTGICNLASPSICSCISVKALPGEFSWIPSSSSLSIRPQVLAVVSHICPLHRPPSPQPHDYATLSLLSWTTSHLTSLFHSAPHYPFSSQQPMWQS